MSRCRIRRDASVLRGVQLTGNLNLVGGHLLRDAQGIASATRFPRIDAPNFPISCIACNATVPRDRSAAGRCITRNDHRSVGTRTAAIILAAILAGGCSGLDAGPRETHTGAAPMQLTSASFADGEAIPSRHSCDGADVSPALAWDGVPEGVSSFVLIV